MFEGWEFCSGCAVVVDGQNRGYSLQSPFLNIIFCKKCATDKTKIVGILESVRNSVEKSIAEFIGVV